MRRWNEGAQSGRLSTRAHSHIPRSLEQTTTKKWGHHLILREIRKPSLGGWNLARTRNPHKLTSRSQHKEPSGGERYQTPESSILRLCKPELVGNEHVGAAILTTQRATHTQHNR